ncbi:MAG: glycosyltransferase [candidate division Zixibacteria bacterium]|nr:glycosyltransferase family 2 protein [candidate division Zixibacteria bacterium]NIS48057.1 glycosyltransferase family 2 protein [candidate division Zixibacteria bacterium]NIU16171.1 glycosyltransferase family 2 protein [candidate division Zixibacteria bacterium]NIV08309.1 glycosyltransferase [candidate division Zixibacteria bacterium]
MKREPLSVVMIARNEEKNLERAIESVSWAEEICLMDTGSTDRTVVIAGELGAKVDQIKFEGFGKAKQAAAAMASHDWLFSIDCDEQVSPELRDSIEKFLMDTEDYCGAEISRLTNFCGKWIFHSGWFPEYVLRLFNKRKAGFNDRYVHEGIRTNGRIRRLDGHLLHYSYPDLRHYLGKVHQYAQLAALQKQPKPLILDFLSLAFKPPFIFIKKLIIQRGFFDGLDGFWIASITAYGQFLKYYYVLTSKKTK